MQCPVCKETELRMTVREGVEIDYCPKCRGVWLDRGELDKIIERTADYEEPAQPPAPRPALAPQARPRDEDDRRRYEDDRRRYDDDDRRYYDKRYKRKSKLKELFDFDLF